MILKAVFCIIVLHCGAVGAHCPNGWTRFLDSCYFFSHDASTFTEAEHYCRQHDSHLVHVNSAAEEAFLKGFLMELKRGLHWLGLTDRDIEKVWTWVDADQPVAYTDWYPGQPNQGTEANCVAIRDDHNYLWTDERCSDTYYPICEKGFHCSLVRCLCCVVCDNRTDIVRSSCVRRTICDQATEDASRLYGYKHTGSLKGVHYELIDTSLYRSNDN